VRARRECAACDVRLRPPRSRCHHTFLLPDAHRCRHDGSRQPPLLTPMMLLRYREFDTVTTIRRHVADATRRRQARTIRMITVPQLEKAMTP